MLDKLDHVQLRIIFWKQHAPSKSIPYAILIHSECIGSGWRDGESHETQLHGLCRGVLG